MGQALSLGAGDDRSVHDRRALLRDPLAILIAASGLLLAGFAIWWLARLGNAGAASEYTGFVGLPAGGLLGLGALRLWRTDRLDRATRRMWAIIALALAVYALGAILHLAALSAPVVGFLGPVGVSLEIAAYPVSWFALLALPGPTRSRTDTLLIGLDVAIVAWSASMLGWHFGLYPLARQSGADITATFGSALFPGLDLATFCALGAAVLRVPKLATAVALTALAVAIASVFAGDLVAGVENLQGRYYPGGLSGLFYSFAWFAIAVGAYLQWRLPQRERSVRRPTRYGQGLPWLPYVALAVAFTAPAVRSWNDRELLQQHIPSTGLLMALVVARLALTARDNSRLAAAERERLAVAVEQAAEAIVTTDRDSIISYVNPAFVRITGYTYDEVVGHSMEVLRTGSGSERIAEMNTALRRGESWEGRLEGRRRDGAMFQIDMAVAPLRDPDGAITGAVGVARDISRETELETELAQSQRMEAVGRLAGGVAHDFNNILTVISGFSELAAAELPPDHPVAEDIAEIVKASDRAASLTRALLAFSRRQVMRAQTVDLNDIVAGMMPMLEVLMGEDVLVVVKQADRLGPTIADRAQLEQVILNLATNARDAMPQGGRLTIATRNAILTERWVSAHVGANAGPHIALSIADTGVGMTREVKEHAFEPFFTTKERGKGTGLGLSTVIGVVQQTGGYVQVESRPGAGTEFTIYLPRTQRPTPAEEEAAAAAEAAADEAPAKGGRETILVAEDEGPLRTFVGRILRQAGYRVLAAANGPEALELAKKEARVDLLLTDMVMPGMDGPELAGRLAALRPGLPVIFASGYSEEALREGFGDEQRGPYLAKPFTAESLLARVREVLDNRASQKRLDRRASKRNR